MFASLRSVRARKDATRTPSAVPVGDFGQKKRVKRRASSRKKARRFFYPKSWGLFFWEGHI
jgi:hypothetical protein